MNFTEVWMQAAMVKGAAQYFIRGFFYTLLGTFGLAVVVESHGSISALQGAELGAFIGLCVVGRAC